MMRQAMCGFAGVCVWAAAAISAFAVENETQSFTTPERAAADPDFALQGEYVAPQLGVQVAALGKGQFLVVMYGGGLPGAGWNGADRQELEEDAAFVLDLINDRALKKTERQSPTLGAKPPPGAVVLFDGSEQSLKQHWQNGARLDGALLEQGATGTDRFADFVLHVEFRLPYMPAARGQERGNSGVYLQGRYEAQLLDSFGLIPKDNECGALYGVRAPNVNACLPPLAWQTYDVEFTAARSDAAGKQTAAARVTVRHNGIVVHQDVRLPESPGPTAGALVESGSILLQDHGNPVRFRNLWVAPRSAEREARRPVIPGFERFYAATGADPAEGGRLLVGELNCTACHAADEKLARHFAARQAPILDVIGKYTPPEYLLTFLTDPHGTKPGTAMPDLLGGLPAAEREGAVLALVNLLASTGTVPERGSDIASGLRGAVLFREVGCLACHDLNEPGKPPGKTSAPLANLAQKYSVASLAAFLREPHKVRPAGRMPTLIREDQEAIDLATYLAGAGGAVPQNRNLRFAVYQGNWNNVPNFDELKPARTGQSAGFDLSVARRSNDFGMRFDGSLKIEKEGEYTFHLGSDDGSVLKIDGRKIADSDGVHPHTVNSGKVALKAGFHKLQVDYAQVAGEASLTLEMEGPGVARQDANRMISLSEREVDETPAAAGVTRFRFDASLVEKGRTLFASLGCASCHQLKQNGEPIKSQLAARPLSQLKAGEGCLSDTGTSASLASASAGTAATGTTVRGRWPQFDLNSPQRVALTAALETAPPAEAPTAKDVVARTMTVFNCYACHARAGVGGPEHDRNPLFLTSIHEMGDEARIPPPLDGVGDKLTTDWLRHVLQEGSKDRPYMRARMPKFTAPPVAALADAFVALDRRNEAALAKLPEAEHRVKAVGRHLAGDKALGCVKCHTFGLHKPAGVKAIDLTTIARRVRDDWFLRYMVDPQAYRPGTRMPTGFANGQASVRDVYDGSTELQLAALWTYLKDGDKAGIPDGLLANVIELKPETRPIIYRNFLEGLSPRGIAVGYPERVHLAWDAGTLSLALVWHGRFIDAGKHWEGRGSGLQSPLGDHVMKLEETSPLARLDSPQAAWPKLALGEAGYRFRGYKLDADGRPRFLYTAPGLAVEDFPKPLARSGDTGFVRTVKIEMTGAPQSEAVYFRAAPAGKIERQEDGAYLIDGNVRIRLSGGKPFVRESGGRQELLVPVDFTGGRGQIVEEIEW